MRPTVRSSTCCAWRSWSRRCEVFGVRRRVPSGHGARVDGEDAPMRAVCAALACVRKGTHGAALGEAEVLRLRGDQHPPPLTPPLVRVPIRLHGHQGRVGAGEGTKARGVGFGGARLASSSARGGMELAGDGEASTRAAEHAGEHAPAAPQEAGRGDQAFPCGYSQREKRCLTRAPTPAVSRYGTAFLIPVHTSSRRFFGVIVATTVPSGST